MQVTARQCRSTIFALMLAFVALQALGQGTPAKSKRVKRHSLVKAQSTLTAAQIYAKYKAYVCTVTTDSGLGTGFNTPGGVWTCSHVIEGAKSVSVKFAGIPAVSANDLVAFDKPLDIAIVWRAPTSCPALTINANVAVNVGDPLVVIGSPHGLDQSLTEGILSGKRLFNGIEYLQLSAPVSPGSSGSPVFNKYGNVVGMVVGCLPDSQQINFALSAASLIRFHFGIPIADVFKKTGADDGRGFDLRTFLDTNKFAGHVLSDPETLTNTPKVQVLVEDTGEELKDAAPKDLVRQWIVADLARLAPKLKVVTSTEAEAEYTKPQTFNSLQQYLGHDDAHGRLLYLNITFIKAEPTSFCNVTLQFCRPGLTAVGTTISKVWDRAISLSWGRDDDKKELIKILVERVVKAYADDWLLNNH